MSTVPSERKAAAASGCAAPGALAPHEAWAQLAPWCTPLPAERVALAQAAGRTLAETVRAPHALPREDNSAMDGFAVRSANGAYQRAAIAGESRAGHPFRGPAGNGAVVRIATGGAMPAGFDAVIPVEQATAAGEEHVTLPAAPAGQHVRRAGEDLAAGAVVAAIGTRLAPHHLGALAGAGLAERPCTRRPRVALVVTGDEVVAPGLPLTPGQVTDVHGAALPPLIAAAGGELIARVHAGDAPGALAAALAELPAADLVLVTGGLSVGRHDHTRPAITQLGALLVERLAMRPGQPTAIWVRDDPRTLWFGLPGNPVAAFVIATLFVVPALRALSGQAPRALEGTSRRLTAPAGGDPRRWLALRAVRDGSHVTPLGAQGSHMVSGLAAANALALIPPSAEPHPAGREVTTITLLGGVDA